MSHLNVCFMHKLGFHATIKNRVLETFNDMWKCSYYGIK